MLNAKGLQGESNFKYHVRYVLSELFRTALQVATDTSGNARELRIIKAQLVDIYEQLNRIENQIMPIAPPKEQDTANKDMWKYHIDPLHPDAVPRLNGRNNGA